MCKALRSAGGLGFCGIGAEPVVSSAGPHLGEERVLVGTGGSGTIFFSGCNLACVFCQNYQISHLRQGRPVSVERLARTMLALEEAGCQNVNLVSPTHIIPPVARAITMARSMGLTVPIVYNTGGYDRVETLRLLEGLIEIYMPDMKYADGLVAGQLSQAPDYPQVNRAAVLEMHRQVGDLQVVDDIAVKGLLVRHLVLPNDMAGSRAILDFLAEQVSPRTAVNVMAQYRPCYKAFDDPRISRPPTRDEVTAVKAYARNKGLTLID